MKYTHILWDWNGTLLDDVAASIECVNDLLDTLGRPHTNLEEYYQMMDIPMKKYYDNLLGENTIPYELCTENFQKSYPERIKSASLADNAVEILDYLKDNGAKQYIVSSFEQERLRKYVEMFKISGYFEEISGDKDIHVGSKSKRAKKLINSIDTEKVLYIGDTVADFNTAKEVGCDCILICKGHQPRELLETFGCTVIDNLIEIKDYI